MSRTIVITGAAVTIGAAVVEKFKREGWKNMGLFIKICK
jgi:NAD(P)-dependent dehydrogenase (short-subunit alcohol dehydrogenase family)